MALEVFLSYAHQDQAFRRELEKHLSSLRRLGIISSWSDSDIVPGTEWRSQIMAHLNTAQVILLLISADFMDSEFCYSLEMTRAIEKHKANEARVLPIIVRPCDWKSAPFAELEVLPAKGRAVTRWPSHDDAFENVVQGIRIAIDDLAKQADFKPSLLMDSQVSGIEFWGSPNREQESQFPRPARLRSEPGEAELPRQRPAEPRPVSFGGTPENPQTRSTLSEDLVYTNQTQLKPKKPPELFFGREKALQEGQAHILAGYFPLLVHGIPGIGKTTFLARLFDNLRKLAHDQYSEDNIIWIDMRDDGISSDSEIADAIAKRQKYERILNLNEKKTTISKKLDTLRYELLGALPEHIIVFDNVDTPEHRKAVITFQERVTSRIVVGSREPVALDRPKFLHLRELSSTAAVNIFKSYAERDVPEDDEAIKDICHLLGYLTQAIKIIALSGMYEDHTSLELQYRQLQVENRRLDVLSPEAESDTRNLRLTFGYSYNNFKEKSKLIFDVCGALASSGAPLAAIIATSGLSELECQALLDSRPIRGLIEKDEQKPDFYKMHQLLHDFAREKLQEREKLLQNQGVDFHVTPTGRMISYYVRYARRHEQIFPKLEEARDNLLLAARQAWRYRQWKAVHGFWDLLSSWLDATGDWKNDDLLSRWALHVNSKRRLPGREVELANVLYSRSSYHEMRGRIDIAVRYAQISLALGLQVNHDKTIVNAMVSLAFIYQGHLNQHKEGHAFLEEAWRICERIPDWDEVSYVAYQLGQSYWSEGELDAAIEWFQKCREIAQKRQTPLYEGYALNSLGSLLSQQGNLVAARQYLEQSLELKQRVGNKYSIAITLASLAGLMENEGNLMGAIAKLKEALEIYHGTGRTATEMTTLRDLGNLYYSAGLYGQAIATYTRATELNQQVDLPTEQATILLRLGQAYEAINNFDEALFWYERRLKILQSLPESPEQFIGMTWIAMGKAHEARRRPQQALMCYEKARELLGTQFGSLEMLEVLGQLKIVYEELHRGDLTSLLVQAGHLLAREVKQADEQKNGPSLLRLGYYYITLREFELAKETFDRVQDLLHVAKKESTA